jgi:hypothetical protein
VASSQITLREPLSDVNRESTVNAVPERSEQIQRDTAHEQEIRQAQLDERALDLRRQSVSFRAIAEMQGCSLSTAFERVQRATSRERQESPEQVRANLAAGLDEVLLRMRSIMLSRDSTRSEAIKAAEQYVRASERKAKMTGADMPGRRIEIVKVMDEEERRKERDRLDAELEAAGVDLSILPSVEQLAMKLLATRPSPLPESTPVEPATCGGIALRRLDGPVPDSASGITFLNVGT